MSALPRCHGLDLNLAPTRLVCLIIKTHLIDPQLETIFRIGAVEAMAGEDEAADGVRVSNAGRAVVLEIAVAART